MSTGPCVRDEDSIVSEREGTDADTHYAGETPPFRFSFKGDTAEYFRIFYVNLLLTLVTFGVYSAWAKVRSRKFFYGNLYLGGHNMDFDARPLSILTARVIVVAAIAVLLFSEDLLALAWEGIGAMTLLLLFLIPFALVRGRSFNARHTVHRSVRFRYVKNYRPSYWLYVLYYLFAWIVLTVAASLQETAGSNEFLQYLLVAALSYWALLFPAYHYYRHKILVNQFCLGKLDMSYHARVKSYYRHFVVTLLWSVPIIAFFTVSSIIASIYLYTSFELSDWNSTIAVSILAIGTLFLALSSIGVYRSRILPVFYSSIRLGDGSKLLCSINSKTYLFKYFLVNLIVIFLSLGILLPWARVRSWRYVTESLSIVPSSGTATILASDQEDLGPLGEEFTDVQDFDLDFGFI